MTFNGSALAEGFVPPEGPMKLIGRADALRQVSQLLLQPDVRMVTLTGPAGVGKTRLAIEVAGEVQTHFEDGVVFVDLTRISDPALVLPTIAKALQARESIGSTLGDVVLYRLQAMSMLLIVDCFEHLQSAAPQVSKLLEDWRTRHVKLLVTSRERLRLSWESVYEVLPLAVPSDATTIDARQARRSPAVMLLTQLARANRPDFKVTDQNVTAVVDICRRLDGLPLALALSAPHLAHVEPQELAARLQPTLPLLDKSPRDAPERHRTMRTAIAWSYERLDPFEQALFRQLSVFVGGFTAELARDLAEFDTNSPDRATSTTDQAAEIGRALDALCDKSLVQRVPNGRDSRFRMLAPLRDFAQEQAERHGEAETVRRRLGSHFVELAAQTDPRLSGSRQVSWLNFIEAERANLDAVLQWSLKQG